MAQRGGGGGRACRRRSPRCRAAASRSSTPTMRTRTSGARAARRAGRARGDVRARSHAPTFSARCTPRADGSELELATPGGRLRASTRGPGRHMARNALAATAAALADRRRARRGRARARRHFAPSRGGWRRCAPRPARSCSTTRTTPIPIRCAPRSTCSPHAPADTLAGVGRHGRGGRAGSRVPSRDRRLRARAGRRRACMRPASSRAKRSPRSAPARRTSTTCATLAALLQRDGARRRHAAGQGLALHADGARGGRAHRASSGRRRTDAAAARRMARAVRPRVQRVRLHHAARGAGDDDRARHLVHHRPADDRVAVADEDRPVGARRRPADASRRRPARRRWAAR